MNEGVERRSRSLLLIALGRILKPLVRLLLAYDIKYTMLLEELKRVYVNVAESEFKLEDGEQTDSRVSFLTGIHRKEVKRIRSESVNDTVYEPRRLSLTSQIIALWLRDPANLDANGLPIPLPRMASVGGEKSFEALVAKVSKDIRARPVLDEWLNLGLVTIDDDEFVHLNMQAFIPNQNVEEKLFYLSMNVHDHLATAVNNIQAKEPPFLERCIYYYGLTQENVDILHEASKEAGLQSLAAINRLAMALKSAQKIDTATNRLSMALKSENKVDNASNEKQTLKRINFGVYFHSSSEIIELDPRKDKPH